jgi:hypothetical protein
MLSTLSTNGTRTTIGRLAAWLKRLRENSSGTRQFTSAAKAAIQNKISYRSAEALRHPKSTAESSFSAIEFICGL